jgi:hypothetical protein
MYSQEEIEKNQEKLLNKNRRYQTFLKSIVLTLIIYILITKPIKIFIKSKTNIKPNIIISITFFLLYNVFDVCF